jgi:glycosyltransferase involved in cell wall biosynthesis
VLRDDKPEVIYSTSPHATAHLIALALARASRLPWVADFRDPWFEPVPEPGAPSGALYMRLNRMLETLVVERCSHVVTSTTHLRDELRARYAQLPQAKITAIPNGYDEADFAAVSPRVAGERFVIVHAGSINADFRDPRPLFSSLRRQSERGRVASDRIAVRVNGGGEYADSAAMREALVDVDLTSQVAFIPRIPFGDTLREFAAADLLLLLQASADTVGLVPAKLYEYLRAQRPVLALVQPGAAAEVLAATGGGWTIDPRDEVAMDNVVEVAYNAWKAGSLGTCSANLDALRQFDRRVLTGQLASIFAQLSVKTSAASG